MAGLEAAIDFVDDVKPAAAAYNAIGAMAFGKRFEGIADFHWPINLIVAKAGHVRPLMRRGT